MYIFRDGMIHLGMEVCVVLFFRWCPYGNIGRVGKSVLVVVTRVYRWCGENEAR